MSGPGHWLAVARLRDLGRKPLRVMVDGEALVLFRSGGGVAALVDRCPHRHTPLSKGRVVEGAVECPYHGWRFGAEGWCVAVPGLEGPCPRLRARTIRTTVADGAVFIAHGVPRGSPVTVARPEGPTVTAMVRSSARARLIDAVENILDATHTHFAHKGLLRGLTARRTPVNVTVSGGADWVEARYEGEPRPDGLVSRLLEGTRVETRGRFQAPGIVELSYVGRGGLALRTTFHLRQATDDRVEGIGWLVAPRQGGLGHLKALAFGPVFRLALRQDQRILAAAHDNRGPSDPVIGPLDVLRRDIAAILEGRRPPAADTPRIYRMWL